MLYMSNRREEGFTLIEILIVVVIISILTTIVFAILNNARDRASKASALSSVKSVMSELVNCQNDNGFADTNAITAGQIICCNTVGTGCVLAGARPGHNVAWPSLGKTGWSYGTGADIPSGTLADSNYTFKITKTGETTISCSLTTGNCQ